MHHDSTIYITTCGANALESRREYEESEDNVVSGSVKLKCFRV